MDFEKFLNDNKNKIWKFEVYESLLVIHIEDNGVVEIDTDSIDYPLNISHIVNSTYGTQPKAIKTLEKKRRGYNMDLETIKKRDDTLWLSVLKNKFDTDSIKAHKEWLIEQAEQLERIKQLSNAEELTLVDFAKEVLKIIEGREATR